MKQEPVSSTDLIATRREARRSEESHGTGSTRLQLPGRRCVTLGTMCPDCRVPLVGFELGPVEIDRCVDCGGTWLDAGELEAIVRFSGANRSGLCAATATGETADHEPATRRRCPRCRRRLRLHAVGEDAGRVEVERCPVSHGLWLDKGEMEAIVMQGAYDGGGAVARFFSELYRGDRASAPEGE